MTEMTITWADLFAIATLFVAFHAPIWYIIKQGTDEHKVFHQRFNQQDQRLIELY